MKRPDWDNLSFLRTKPPDSIEPRLLGWLLSGLLTIVGMGLIGSELLLLSDRRWAILSSGASYVALAVIVCPRSESPFWLKLLASTIAGVFIL